MNQAFYRCPECGGTDLRVECSVTCKLHQTEENFETEPINGAEWYFDRKSWMHCATCDFDGKTRDFETTPRSTHSGLTAPTANKTNSPR